ncbi:hypothetical protein CJO92_19370 (plasmid) [Ralstonia solanacearum]|uniref:Uncharacterized protein n=1 Tax=Ralstonia solanacearum TaxID=305 RepID=A0AAD0WI25_RALSL|nr:hypothetical protein CJO77_19370 [Ralstonia solanacearum]AXW54866.1 hypothetical protein CJO92_19370 [Ralstonia solanacearum]
MGRRGVGLPGHAGLRSRGWRFVLACRRGCGMHVDCVHRSPAGSEERTRGPCHVPDAAFTDPCFAPSPPAHCFGCRMTSRLPILSRPRRCRHRHLTRRHGRHLGAPPHWMICAVTPRPGRHRGAPWPSAPVPSAWPPTG